MKIAIICQRFGKEIIGGAESHCYHLAQMLADQADIHVEILTTRAIDYMSWKNHFPKEVQSIQKNWLIRRFSVLFERQTKLFGIYNRYIYPALKGKFPKKIDLLLEKVWYVLQGPYCPSLVKHIENNQNNFDKILFFTYLYYPTICGAKVLPKNSYLIVPTCHDEPALYFWSTASLLNAAKQILVNTEAEKKLIAPFMENKKAVMDTLGIHISEQITAISTNLDSAAEDYILYVGRLDDGKNLRELFEFFKNYKAKNPLNVLKLKLIGPNSTGFEVDSNPDITYEGMVSEKAKIDLIQKAKAIIHPSHLESLSLVVLEALYLERPVILNTYCSVFAEYESKIDAVIGYKNINDFIHALDEINKLYDKPAKLKQVTKKARKWVDENYSKNTIKRKLLTALKSP